MPVCGGDGAAARRRGLRGSRVQSAESFLARHDPNAHGCIILDVAMPGLDGLALQQALAERGNHMPIIFLTGHADVPMCAQAMKCGAFDFLTKPVDETMLFAAVARALASDEAAAQGAGPAQATESRLSDADGARARGADPCHRRAPEQADRGRPRHGGEDRSRSIARAAWRRCTCARWRSWCASSSALVRRACTTAPDLCAGPPPRSITLDQGLIGSQRRNANVAAQCPTTPR